MIYLLDTNIISALHDQSHPFHIPVIERFQLLEEEAIVMIHFLTIFELEYSTTGCKENEKRIQVERVADTVFTDFPYINLSREDAKHFARIKTAIKTKYKISSENMKKYSIDLMIASSAISNNAVFVSHDRKLLEKINSVDSSFVFESWID